MEAKDELYVYPEGCREISVFGGSYEKECRDMVVRGMKYFYDHPDEKDRFLTCKTYFDLSDVFPDLERAMCTSDELIGAMVGASCSHLRFAVVNGWVPYIAEMQKLFNQEKTE